MNRQPSERHIIWSNLSLDVDDWREAYKEFLEANELDADPNDENGLYEYMVETNDEYLTDERLNLNVRLSQPIIVIGDLGLWNGRRSGYKMIDSGNIKDCLFSDTDYTEWYVDKYGDLRADAVHHDGTNHYLYRAFKDGVSDTQKENLQYKSTVARRPVPTSQGSQKGLEMKSQKSMDFPFRSSEPQRSFRGDMK